MDTLPLPLIVGLQIDVETQSNAFTSSQSKSLHTHKGDRRIAKESIRFSQYHIGVLAVKQFLTAHHGKPFIWAHTGKAYLWTDFSIDHKGTDKGDFSITMIRDTNHD